MIFSIIAPIEVRLIKALYTNELAPTVQNFDLL